MASTVPSGAFASAGYASPMMSARDFEKSTRRHSLGREGPSMIATTRWASADADAPSIRTRRPGKALRSDLSCAALASSNQCATVTSAPGVVARRQSTVRVYLSRQTGPHALRPADLRTVPFFRSRRAEWPRLCADQNRSDPVRRCSLSSIVRPAIIEEIARRLKNPPPVVAIARERRTRWTTAASRPGLRPVRVDRRPS